MDSYFNWMIYKINGGGIYFCPQHYYWLLERLDSIEFTWLLPGDENRAQDGIDLRKRYISTPLGDERDVESRTWCSMLEMMVALSIRCEEHIMDDPDKGDRVSLWFLTMVKSLGLSEMHDKHYISDEVDQIIENFLTRNYKPNGKGGLFWIPCYKGDMRKMEIWYQMQAYMIEEYLPTA